MPAVFILLYTIKTAKEVELTVFAFQKCVLCLVKQDSSKWNKIKTNLSAHEVGPPSNTNDDKM